MMKFEGTDGGGGVIAREDGHGNEEAGRSNCRVNTHSDLPIEVN